MALIDIRRFGGMAPSANVKNMDESSAALARNLSLRFGDFRPLPVAQNVGAAAAGVSLYRMETAGGFMTSASKINYVRGPIAGDVTERTYYTGNGPPKVTDLNGDTRQLGVPAPTVAPAVAVNTVAQYSTDDAAAAQGTKLTEFTNVITANVVRDYAGIPYAEVAATFTNGTGSDFAFKVPGSVVGGHFVPTSPAHYNLIDERLGFYTAVAGGVTTGYVNITMRGQQLAFDASLAADLATIKDPSDLTGVKALLSADAITGIVTSLTDGLKSADTNRDGIINQMRALKDEFITLSNGSGAASGTSVEAMRAFYARPETEGAIDDAVGDCVQSIFSSMTTYS